MSAAAPVSYTIVVDLPDIATRDQQRSRRKREVRGKVEPTRRIAKFRLRLLSEQADLDLAAAGPAERPQTRADCAGGERPCPWVGCRHNLYLDVGARTGNIKFNFPDLQPEQMPEGGSCVLDVADRGGATLERAGELLNVTRERLRQLEVRVTSRPDVRAAFERFEDYLQDAGGTQSTLGELGDGTNWGEGSQAADLEERRERQEPAEDSLNALAMRAYARAVGSADCSAGLGRAGYATAREVGRWSNHVVAELRSGVPVREAIDRANADQEEDRDVKPFDLFSQVAANEEENEDEQRGTRRQAGGDPAPAGAARDARAVGGTGQGPGRGTTVTPAPQDRGPGERRGPGEGGEVERCGGGQANGHRQGPQDATAAAPRQDRGAVADGRRPATEQDERSRRGPARRPKAVRRADGTPRHARAAAPGRAGVVEVWADVLARLNK